MLLLKVELAVKPNKEGFKMGGKIEMINLFGISILL